MFPGLGRASLSGDNAVTMIIRRIRAQPRHRQQTALSSPLKLKLVNENRGSIRSSPRQGLVYPCICLFWTPVFCAPWDFRVSPVPLGLFGFLNILELGWDRYWKVLGTRGLELELNNKLNPGRDMVAQMQIQSLILNCTQIKLLQLNP